MASALARGWGDPVLACDALPGRAQALAEELGGEAFNTNAELAAKADAVLLAHKPAQLEAVAAETNGQAKAVVSILGAVTLDALKAAYPGVPVVRVLPSTPVEVRQGVTCHALDPAADQAFEQQVLDHFRRVGPVVSVAEGQIDTAMALMSCAPAFMALVAEAQVDAGVRAGLPADTAAELVLGNLEGTAALLRAREMDTFGVRRAVTSPGGSTARGLSALEHAGIRSAFDDAVQAVINP